MRGTTLTTAAEGAKPDELRGAMVQHDIELTTARFVLQPIKRDDERLLHELWSSAGVRRFLWDDQAMSATWRRFGCSRS
jgi:hypothetical protein